MSEAKSDGDEKTGWATSREPEILFERVFFDIGATLAFFPIVITDAAARRESVCWPIFEPETNYVTEKDRTDEEGP